MGRISACLLGWTTRPEDSFLMKLEARLNLLLVVCKWQVIRKRRKTHPD